MILNNSQAVNKEKQCLDFIKREISKIDFGKINLEITIKNQRMVNLKLIREERNYNINSSI